MKSWAIPPRYQRWSFCSRLTLIEHSNAGWSLATKWTSPALLKRTLNSNSQVNHRLTRKWTLHDLTRNRFARVISKIQTKQHKTSTCSSSSLQSASSPPRRLFKHFSPSTRRTCKSRFSAWNSSNKATPSLTARTTHSQSSLPSAQANHGGEMIFSKKKLQNYSLRGETLIRNATVS